MPVARYKVILCFVLLICTFSSRAQVITTDSSSTVVTSTATDTLSRGIFGTLKSWDKPSRAALYSTIIPGAGQFYNKSYWKIPVIYAGGITIGYFFNKWHKSYLLYRSSLEIARDTIASTHDAFETRFPDIGQRLQVLSRGVETYRRFRDYNIIFGLLLFGLNVSEAYVDAHLKGFDISDELTLRVEPTIIPGPVFNYAPGIAIRFNLKSNENTFNRLR